MKFRHLASLGLFGLSTILFRRKRPILGTIILTDACNLRCKHCSVNNITTVMHPLEQVRNEMRQLYDLGIRILFFSGGETLLWKSDDKSVRDLVIEAKQMGFYIVNIVTNGTLPINIPEADLILLSMDGDKEHHNLIRGNTYDNILCHIREASANNICLYMAINRLNFRTIPSVCELARQEKNIRAVSFNFHTPYPNTRDLQLSKDQKHECCDTISRLMDEGYPIFNLRSAFPYIINNHCPTPCYQCVVMENGKLSTCGRCVDIPGLCDECGYFFAAEYSLVFHGNMKVACEMLTRYTKFI